MEGVNADSSANSIEDATSSNSSGPVTTFRLELFDSYEIYVHNPNDTSFGPHADNMVSPKLMNDTTSTVVVDGLLHDVSVVCNSDRM